HMAIRDRQFRKFLKKRTPENWKKYKMIRNKVTKMILRSKQHIAKLGYADDRRLNSRVIWDNIRKLVGREVNHKLPTTQMDDLDLANAFNNYFVRDALPNTNIA